MAQYKTGTISVTNGSNTVTSQSTFWSTNAALHACLKGFMTKINLSKGGEEKHGYKSKS